MFLSLRAEFIYIIGMSQEIIQTQEEQQVQTLNALQVGLSQMVALPLMQLSERIQNEMMENSALEEADNLPEEMDLGERNSSDDDNDTYDDDAFDEDQRNIDENVPEMGDYFSEDEIPSYLQARADAERERHEIPISREQSFYDNLYEQMGEYDLTEHERLLMEYLIGSLDDSGFLRKELYTLVDELEIYQGIKTSEEELQRLLDILQQFEPRGIGARSLQECLLIQLRNPELKSPYKEAAIKVVEDSFKEFTGKHWDVIRRRLKVSQSDFDAVINLLTHLNPAPGSAFSESLAGNAPTVVPDFFVDVDTSGNIRVSLNNEGVPELRVSPAFRETIRQYNAKNVKNDRQQREAYIYAKQKVESAQGFINMLQRRNQTMLAVMNEIVRLQRDFFVQDDDDTLLRPMILKDVADAVGIDISTVSRVTSSKYVETAYGIYPLKFFFSNQLTNEEGEELSSRLVKNALRSVIENEDKKKPLSDEKITQLLNKQKLPVARRTVAKYREQLGIPPARLRKNIR